MFCEELEQYFGKKLYETVIPRNVRLAEAPAHGLPIIYFEKSSKGAIAYLNLAAEMLKKSKVKKEIKHDRKKRGLAKGRGLDALLGSIQKENYSLKLRHSDHGQLNKLMFTLLKRGDINHAVLLMSKTYKSLQHRLKNMV